MNTFLPRWFIVVMVAAALGVTGVAGADKPGSARVEPMTELPPLLVQWMQAEKSAGNIHVTFTQSRSTPTLKAPLLAAGEFWRMADGRFRWQIGQPASMILINDGSTVRLKEEGVAEWKTMDPKDRRVGMWLSFLGGQELSSDALARTFQASVASDTPARVAFVLKPRSLVMRKHLRQLELHIDPRTKHLLQMRLVQADESSLTMEFDSPRSAADTPDLFK